MPIETPLGRVFGNQRVDLLRRQAPEHRLQQRFRRRCEAVVAQHVIDRMVAGDVPPALHAVGPPGEMAERAMQRLVREPELQIAEGHAIDEVRIEMHVPCIGGQRLAPLGIGGPEREVERQRADERFFQDQPGTRGRELGERAGLQLRHVAQGRLRSNSTSSPMLSAHSPNSGTSISGRPTQRCMSVTSITPISRCGKRRA